MLRTRFVGARLLGPRFPEKEVQKLKNPQYTGNQIMKINHPKPLNRELLIQYPAPHTSTMINKRDPEKNRLIQVRLGRYRRN